LQPSLPIKVSFRWSHETKGVETVQTYRKEGELALLIRGASRLVFRGSRGTSGLRSRGSSLLKNPSRLADIRDAEENQRRIRLRFQTAISVVDVDVGFPKAGCQSSDLAGSMLNFS
jgi:hypothetical protein